MSATAVTCSLAAQAGRQRGEHVGDEDGGLDGADSGPVPDGSPRRDERGKGSEQRSAVAVKRRKPKKKQAVSAGFFDRASSQKENVHRLALLILVSPVLDVIQAHTRASPTGRHHGFIKQGIRE